MARGIVVDPQAEDREDPNRQADEPGSEPHETQDDLPEKLRGKSQKELAEMYLNLESELGRIRNEIGYVRQEAATWRSLAEQLGTASRTEPETTRKPVEISGDDLIARPKDAIRAVLDEVLDEKLGPVVQDVRRVRMETEAERFVRDFPNYVQIGNDPAFQQWVAQSPRRIALANRALTQEDIGAMRELMEGWEERQALLAELQASQKGNAADTRDEGADTAPTGVQGARRVATEKPGQGGNAHAGKKVFYQSDVINTMLRDPDKYYSEAYQKELLAAMREGRYRK